MLYWVKEGFDELLAFFETGGAVVIAIFFVTLAMWAIIVERFSYLKKTHPKNNKELLRYWKARPDQDSWYAKQIQREIICVARQKTTELIPFLKTLIALCPLLGLLGTVTGMIEVFDVMAIAGSANPRAMASGVSRATIPTMAGMVAALSGIYFAARLDSLAQKEVRVLKDHLN